MWVFADFLSNESTESASESLLGTCYDTIWINYVRKNQVFETAKNI